MVDLKNNIISNRWKERYSKLPDEIKERIASKINQELIIAGII